MQAKILKIIIETMTSQATMIAEPTATPLISR
jgi:hypothetical protein